MTPRTLATAMIVVLAATAVARGQTTTPAAAPAAVEFTNGRWHTITPKAATAPAVAADPELDHVQQLIDARDGEAAFRLSVRWVTTRGKSAPQRDRCLFQIAQSLVLTDELVKAYYYCDELMDEYPASPLFSAALQTQYNVADAYLNGHKDKLLGLAVLDEDEKAVEMLFRIQQRSPGSPLAQRALLRTADYYYASADYDLAHDAYQFFAKTYPRSERAPQAKLRAAFASLAQFRGPRFDAAPMLDARAQLVDFRAAYPALAAEENVDGILVKVDDELAIKLYLTADYYRRTGASTGAVYVYRYLVLTYPRSRSAEQAREALKSMPAEALAKPSPRAGRAYAPPAVPVQRVPVP